MTPTGTATALLGHLAVRRTSVSEEIVDAELEAQRQAFRSGDPLAGLRAVLIAAEHRRPIPHGVATWLSSAIGSYLHERYPTLDAALGLNATGASNPRAILSKKERRLRALSLMFNLQVRAGALIHEAALLVSRLGEYQQGTLIRLYGQLGWGETARALGETALGEPSDILKAYPDDQHTRSVKLAIRERYSKRRP